MQASGYSLDLYCDNWCEGEPCRRAQIRRENHEPVGFPDEFFAERGAVARRMAREAGWKVARKGSDRDLCPECNGHRSATPQ